MLIIMAGLPGTGKTTLARAVARRVGGIVLDKDALRAALSPPEMIEYSTTQDDFVVTLMLQAAAYLLDGEPRRVVVLDGRPFARKYQVEAVVRVAERHAWEWRLVECVAPDQTVKRRLARSRQTHPAANRTFALYQKMKIAWEAIRREKIVVATNVPLKVSVQQVLEYMATNSRYNVVPGMKPIRLPLEPLPPRVERPRLPRMPGPNLWPLFRKLKAILEKRAPEFRVESDAAEYYRLVSKTRRWKRGGSIYFAAVRRDVGEVSFYVGALEYKNRLRVPEVLTPRYQAETYFRFTRSNPKELRALDRLVAAAARWFRKKGWA
jgi:adenylylsulfate kinase